MNDLDTYAQQGIPGLQAVNLGCGGETTTTMINGGHCTSKYSTGSQLGDAEAFLQAHPGQVAFITLDIGADDVLGMRLGGDDQRVVFREWPGQGGAEPADDPWRATDCRRIRVPIVGIEIRSVPEYWLDGTSGQEAAQESVSFVGQSTLRWARHIPSTE